MREHIQWLLGYQHRFTQDARASFGKEIKLGGFTYEIAFVYAWLEYYRRRERILKRRIELGKDWDYYDVEIKQLEAKLPERWLGHGDFDCRTCDEMLFGEDSSEV